MTHRDGPSRPKWEIFNSLKARLVVSALLLILVLLPMIGITLNDAFDQQVKNAAKNELSAYVYSVLAVTEVDNDRLLMPEQLLENRFNVIQSGLYALISTPDSPIDSGSSLDFEAKFEPALESESAKAQLLQDSPVATGPILAWQSNSFLGQELTESLPRPATGQSRFGQIMLEGRPHLIYSFSASFDQGASYDITTGERGESKPFPITIHIIKDLAGFQQAIDRFSRQLWSWLLILMFLLVIIQITWLLWTLRPLAKFEQELRDVERGKRQRLGAAYPTELQAVARQLNTLLNTEQSQRKRYRNALSDLAHSLKTPLAVIQSQKDLSRSSIEQVSIINRIIGHQLKRAQTAAGASWHLGVKVSQVSDKLVRTLVKIYRQPQIKITSRVDDSALFRGDEADLAELLGNVLDNACKAAKAEVALTVTCDDRQLSIAIEDDGTGISPEQEAQIFERGIRADSYRQGHGIGLAIVRDLVDSYNGQLTISGSEKLGGAKFVFRFSLVPNG